MRKRLNGWQRIWIVLAVVGLFVAAFYALYAAQEQYEINGAVLIGFSDPQCKAIVSLPAGYKLDQSPGIDSPCWELHLYRSIYKDARDTADGYAEHMGSLQRSYALNAFGFAFIVWAVVMALIYGTGATVAWVIRGFRSSPT